MRLGWIVGMVMMTVWTVAEEPLHEETEAHLRANMTLQYDQALHDVNGFKEAFAEGRWYGRLRLHGFGYKWDRELNIAGKAVRKDHAILGVGGSLHYESAFWHGFGVGAGLYGTMGLGTLEHQEAYLYKSGKDTLSRYDRLNDGTVGFATFAQAYLAYRYEKSTIKAGRQIFESFLTASNDTKMIPNTFEGVTLQSKELPDTTLKLAYLTRQKLRDHASFHHLFARGVSTSSDPYGVYSQNDDSSMHVGITLPKLQERDIEDRLVVAEVRNRSIDGLSIWANYTAVPELISYGMLQLDYRFDLSGWQVTPAVRYMRQFDDGAGEIAGPNAASRKLISVGYNDPGSLDSWLWCGRIDLRKKKFKLRLGYSQIADRADIIAPWRGFPTGGFTRAMGQYNWYANTRTWMAQVNYVLPYGDHLAVAARYAYEDFDDAKPGVQADANVATLDLLKGFGGKGNLYMKARYAHVWGDTHTPLVGAPGRYKADPGYDELRLEMNYLF